MTCEAPASPPAIVPSLSVKFRALSPHVSLQNFSIMTATFQTDLFTFALDQQGRQLAAKEPYEPDVQNGIITPRVVVQNFDLEEEAFYIDARIRSTQPKAQKTIRRRHLQHIRRYDVTGFEPCHTRGIPPSPLGVDNTLAFLVLTLPSLFLLSRP